MGGKSINGGWAQQGRRQASQWQVSQTQAGLTGALHKQYAPAIYSARKARSCAGEQFIFICEQGRSRTGSEGPVPALSLLARSGSRRVWLRAGMGAEAAAVMDPRYPATSCAGRSQVRVSAAAAGKAMVLHFASIAAGWIAGRRAPACRTLPCFTWRHRPWFGRVLGFFGATSIRACSCCGRQPP